MGSGGKKHHQSHAACGSVCLKKEKLLPSAALAKLREEGGKNPLQTDIAERTFPQEKCSSHLKRQGALQVQEKGDAIFLKEEGPVMCE